MPTGRASFRAETPRPALVWDALEAGGRGAGRDPSAPAPARPAPEPASAPPGAPSPSEVVPPVPSQRGAHRLPSPVLLFAHPTAQQIGGRGCRGADAEEGGQLFRSSRPSACALFAPKQLLSRVRIKEPPAVNQETLGSGFGVPHTSPSVCHFALSSTRSCGPGRAGPGGGLRLPWRRSLGFPQHTHFVCR